MDSHATPTRKPRRGSVTDLTPSGKAKSLLAGLVMTPPRTPPPASARTAMNFADNPTSAKKPAARIKQLHVDTSERAPAPAPRRAEPTEVEEKKGEREEPVLGEGTVTHEGWLMKLKQKNKFSAEAKWGRRWFQIREGFLLYFRTQTSRFPAGWLRLSQITSVVDIPTDTSIPGTPITPPFSFKITLASRVLYMQAKAKDEAAEWKQYLSPQPTTPVNTRAVKVGKTKLPPLVAARLPASPPPASRSPLRSPLKPSMFRDKDKDAGASDSPAAAPPAAGPGAGAGASASASAFEASGTGTGADIVPKGTEWVKCFDTENEAHYYINVATDISTWELPIADADGGKWVRCFDFDSGAVFWAHTKTREERFQDTVPEEGPGTPSSAGNYAGAVTWHQEDGWQGVGVTDEWAAPESGLVWVEGWDEANQVPYYVRFDTGESQWEWPEAEGAQVVQYGSEDYAWYWQWLGGEEAADGAAKTDEAP